MHTLITCYFFIVYSTYFLTLLHSSVGTHHTYLTLTKVQIVPYSPTLLCMKIFPNSSFVYMLPNISLLKLLPNNVNVYKYYFVLLYYAHNTCSYMPLLHCICIIPDSSSRLAILFLLTLLLAPGGSSSRGRAPAAAGTCLPPSLASRFSDEKERTS